MLLLDYIRHRMFLKHPMSLFAKGNKHTAFAQEEQLLAYLTFLLFKILMNKELQLLVAFYQISDVFGKIQFLYIPILDLGSLFANSLRR